MSLVSIVVPVYWNAGTLPELLRRFREIAAALAPRDFEFVLVDDGSGDDSFGVLRREAADDPRVRALRLSRNFGSNLAILAGLTMVVGNFIAVLQHNLKRLLAYSSIAHAGYIMVGMVAAIHPANDTNRGEAVAAVLFYTLAYTVTNLGAFAVLMAFRRRGEEVLELDDYAGLGLKYPALGAAMTLFMISLAGLPPTIGFVGLFYRHQGVPTLLHALAKLRPGVPRLLALVVGDGVMRSEWEATARALDLDDTVRFTGQIPYASAPIHFNAMDVMAAPFTAHRGETSPFKVLDALACERPVVATTLGPASGVLGTLIGLQLLDLLTSDALPATAGRAQLIDMRALTSRFVAIERDPECPACGT